MQSGKITVHLTVKDMHHFPKAMKLNGVTNASLGREVGYDGSMISRIRSGNSSLRADMVQQMLEAMPEQNQFLAMEIAHKIVGITVPVIDGDRIIKEPLAMAIKTMPELSEALAAIQATVDELTIPDEDLKPEDFKDPECAIEEAYDAVLYLMNFIAWVCRKYQFSMQDIFNSRSQKWIAQGIVRKE